MAEPQPMSGRPVRLGDHLYQQCPDCRQIIKMTGFWKGWHLCAGGDS